MPTVENRVVVAAPAQVVWDRVVTSAGFNAEMRPWISMSLPRAARGLTVETVPLGTPVGRAWLRLFGVVPFDYDRLIIVELEPGRRFLEQSTMFSMRRWDHERVLTTFASSSASGTEIHDRVTFEPRLPLRPLTPLLIRGIDAFFRHRQRRLVAHFGPNLE